MFSSGSVAQYYETEGEFEGGEIVFSELISSSFHYFTSFQRELRQERTYIDQTD